MTPLATVLRPADYDNALSNLMRETHRSRDECAAAYAQAGNLFARAKTLLLKEANPKPPPPTPPAERKRTPAKEKTTEDAPAKFVPASSAFPHPMPAVPVMLPGDGSPEAITDYFNKQYGVKPHNSTAERARRLCGKIAKTATAEGYRDVGDWRADWTQQRESEEDYLEATEEEAAA